MGVKDEGGIGYPKELLRCSAIRWQDAGNTNGLTVMDLSANLVTF